MLLADPKDNNTIWTFINLIKVDYSQWHIVRLRFEAKSEKETDELLKKYIDINADKEGFCMLEAPGKAFSVVKLGVIDSYSAVKREIERNMGNKKCRVLAKKMSANSIKQIQINLTADETNEKKQSLVLAREDREKNVILVIDDDLFIRKTLVSLLSDYGEVHEIDDGKNAVKAYAQYNPDVVLLDIHMPESNGLLLLAEILDIDPDAYVVMSSSDSIKENVVVAIEHGAVGFLVKPIQKDKIKSYLGQCITFAMS